MAAEREQTIGKESREAQQGIPAVDLTELKIIEQAVTSGMLTPTGIIERLKLNPVNLVRISNPIADLTSQAVPVAERLHAILATGYYDSARVAMMLESGAVGIIEASRATPKTGVTFEATENLRKMEEPDHYYQGTADWKGLVYFQSGEDLPPFVKNGALVTAETTVLWWFVTKGVEGLLLAGADGIIEFFVKNGDPVEPGNLGLDLGPDEVETPPTLLFRIKPVVTK